MPVESPTEAQRKVALARLRELLAEGELSLDEYTDRLDIVIQAQTVHQMDDAFRWLDPTAPANNAAPRHRRRAPIAGALIACVLVVIAVLFARASPPPSAATSEKPTTTESEISQTTVAVAEPASPSGITYRKHPIYGDIADLIVFTYTGDGTHAPATAETAVGEFLEAITARDFSTARSMLCKPLRAEFPTAAAIEERLFRELQVLFTDFEILASRSASGNVRYALSRANWGQGPLEVRMVQEEGAWRACGAGLEGARLGFLVSGANGY